MRLGILVDELAPGSAPKLIGWPIRKLAEIGVDAEALVVIDKGHWQRNREHYDRHLGGVKIRYLFPSFPAWARAANFRFPGMSFFSLHHVMSGLFAHRAVGDREFDMVIGHCQYSAFAARNLKRRRGIPFLLLLWDPSTFTARKIYAKRFGWKYPALRVCAAWLDRYALRECEGVITSGRFHHEHLRRLTDKPLHVLYPGCFVCDALPPFSSRERMFATYDRWDIGNIPNVFVDILARLAAKDVTLTIGGFWHPASLRDDFEKAVTARGMQSRVRLLGPLNEEQIMDLCSRAMVHVHPVHEAFGMQTLEAAACGCPGVIPAGSGAAELFRDGVSGFHPPDGDIDAVVRVLDRVFADPSYAENTGRAAWEAARSHTWLDHARSIKAILENHAGH
jgi:glycosyltransferase involved in cell wall biosynthesis